VSFRSTSEFQRRRAFGWRSFCAIPVCSLLVALLLAPGWPAAASGEGDVSVGGEHILTVRFPASGMSIKQRADAITERLVTILSDPNLKPEDIVAVPLGKDEAKIMVKDKLLVTVDKQTARFNTTTPLALARSWTVHLRKVLPEVNVQPNPNDTSPPAGGKQGPSHG
jgi:hypothetical protein